MREDAAAAGSQASDETPTRVSPSDEAPTRAEAGTIEAFAPGRQVGRFILLREIGRGGMGSVFAAYDETLDRQIALKVVRPSPGATEGLARLLREARALARLAHPNVVAVHDAGEFSGHVFIAMELVQGETLRTWLRAEKRPWRAIVAIFVQACRGLAAAHHAGIVHRDFKPANVIVGADGRVRVLDFGLARGAIERARDAASEGGARPSSGLDASTIAGAISGTPAYMAPEQLCGGPIDARTDVFAVCAALHEALFGRRPFGETLAERQAALADPRPPSPPRGDAPAWLRAEVLRGLAHDPAQRHASMDALLAALDRDPTRRRARVLGVGLLAGSLVAGGYAAATQTEPRVCAAIEAEALWPAEARGSVATALRSAGVSYGAATEARVLAALDAYAAQWQAVRAAACRDHAGGTHTAELYGLQTACLEDRRDAFVALVERLSAADRDIAEQASEATLGLPTPARCEDIAALTAAVPPPEDPAVAAEVTALRRKLAAARVAIDLYRDAEGLAIVAPIVARAEQIGYLPLLAEALFLEGRLREGEEDDRAPARLLSRSLWLAERVRDDRQVARAMVDLLRVLASHRRRPAEALAWRDHAEALLYRLDAASEESVGLRAALGFVLTKVGEYDEAERVLTAALRDATAHHGVDAPFARLARRSLANLAAARGRHAEALALYRENFDLVAAIYGPAHPRVVEPLLRISECELALGELAAALRTVDQALALGEAAQGADAQLLDAPRIQRLYVLSGLGRLREAAAVLEQTVASQRRRGASAQQRAIPLNNLAALRARLGAWAEAGAGWRETLALLEAAGEGDSPMTATLRVNLAEARIQLGDRAVEGDLARARAVLDAQRVPPEDPTRQWLALLEAYLDALADRPERALARLAEIEALAPSSGANFDDLRPRFDEVAILALRRIKRHEEAAARARELLAWLEGQAAEAYPDVRARVAGWLAAPGAGRSPARAPSRGPLR